MLRSTSSRSVSWLLPILLACGLVLPLAADPFGDAVGQSTSTWTTSGDAPWSVVTDVSFEGGSSVRSGKIGNRQSTTLSTTVNGPVTVDFRWKVSSESGSDKLTFNAVDLESGVSPSRTISGEQDWQVVSVVLQARPYRLEWVYTKDGGFSSGSDAGWVDQLVFSAAPPSAPEAGSLTPVSVAVGKPLTLVPKGLKGSPLSYQWFHDGAPVPNATNRSYSVAAASLSDAGSYKYVLSNALGTATSPAVAVDVYTSKRFATLASFPITNAPIRNVGLITSAGTSRHFASRRAAAPAGIPNAPEPVLAYVEAGNTLNIFDLSDPTNPTALIPDRGTGIGRPAYYGGVHYHADGQAGVAFESDHNPTEGGSPTVASGHIAVAGKAWDVRWMHAADGEYLAVETDSGLHLFRANPTGRIVEGAKPVSVLTDSRLGSSLPSAFEVAGGQALWGTATGGFLIGSEAGSLAITTATPPRISPTPFVGPAALGTLGGPEGGYLASMGVGWLSIYPKGADGSLAPASVIPISDTILQTFGETSVAADGDTVIVSGYRAKTAAFDVGGAVRIGKQSAIQYHDFMKPGNEIGTPPSYVDYSAPLGILGAGNTVTIFTLVAREGAPRIDRQPVDLTIKAGETGTLSVGATGDGTLTYQWYLKIDDTPGVGLSLNGQTSPQLTLTAPHLGPEVYFVEVRNEYGTARSRNTVVTGALPPGPSITRQPVGGIVDGFEHSVAPLSTDATGGTGTLSFQWFRVVDKPGGLTEAKPIAGATGRGYDATESGRYYVRVTDTSGAHDDSAEAAVVFVGGCIRFAEPYVMDRCADATSTSVTLLRTPARDGWSLAYAEDVTIDVFAASLEVDLPDRNSLVTAHFDAGQTKATLVLGREIPTGAIAKLEIVARPGRSRLCQGMGDVAFVSLKKCQSTVEFTDGTKDINEDDPHHRIHVAVERNGDSSQAVSVKYRTRLLPAGPNAASASDILESVGTLFFAPGQTNGVITVGIVDDALPEQTETFQIELFEPQGTSVGQRSTIDVAIHDDDWPAVNTTPTTVEEKDCISIPTSIQVAWTDGIVVLPYRRLAIPEANADAEIEVFVAPLDAAAGELPAGVVAAVEGIDFVVRGNPLKFPATASQETERDLLLLVRRGIAETNVIRRIKLIADFNSGAIPCNGDTTYVDLVSPTNAPPKVAIRVEPGADGGKIRIDSDAPGYPRVARELGGAFEPLNPPALPLRVAPGTLPPGSSGFVAWYPIPLVPGVGGPDQPPIPGRRVDFGDAPASYEVLPLFGPAAAGRPAWPASHVIDPGLHLGALIDGEAVNQPGIFADGDDTHGLPDDDGVVFRRPLVAGMLAEIVVTSSRAGFLDAWIDYGRDGSFLPSIPGATEDGVAPSLVPPLRPGGVPRSIPLVAGANTLRFRVPGGAVPGPTFARFRLSSRGGLSPLFPAPDGEVEDYAVHMFGSIADFGDAPDDGTEFRYPTRLDHGGAFHLATIPQFFLGTGIDFESDGLPDPDALGDDNNAGIHEGQVTNGRDEDGLASITGLALGKTAALTVTATIKTVPDGKLDAWIDWNRDGDWDDAGEHILSSGRIVDGTNTYSIPVPAGARPGKTYLRLRLTRSGITTPGGPANEGEVEDHAVVIGP